MTPDKGRQLIVDWNDTAHADARDKCVPQAFEEQVFRSPDAVAAIFDGQQLMYHELNARANRLAQELIVCGVGPEVLVGLCLEPSPELLIGMLAILKAGGAYVPLEPSLPPERLAFAVADARLELVLASRQSAERLAGMKITVMAVNKSPSVPLEDFPNPPPRAHPSDLAYVIYTSGSTGQPKGVMIEQGALANHMAWMSAAYPLQPGDRVLFRTSIGFDASVWEIWLPLLSGAAVCVASAETVRDPGRLLDFINESGVSIAQFVPTLLSAVCDLGRPRPSRLRLVFSGGEPLSRELAQKIIAGWKLPIVNLYGPTETTIQVTHFACRDMVPEIPTLPIGSPIWNARVYVLDSQRQPVPVGVAGELYIGGDCLARGYLNQPELTAEKFGSNPFSDKPGARLYRTGDMARWRADGNLEFLGRLDHQVKLRGFRIELGEIEAALLRHPNVREAVVVMREDRSGDKRLAAYVVARQVESPPTATELRRFVHEKLPEYMVPAAFVPLDALPLTPNGKVDRKALPIPVVNRRESGMTYAAPRTPVEVQLEHIWSEILGLDHVGIDDNFFDAGGHSLLATRLVSKIRETFQVELPLRTVFELPTIEGLALYLLTQQAQAAGSQKIEALLAALETRSDG